MFTTKLITKEEQVININDLSVYYPSEIINHRKDY